VCGWGPASGLDFPLAAVPEPPVRKTSVFVVFLTVFIDLLGFGMIVPLLSRYAVNYGATSFQAGLLVASYSLAQFIFRGKQATTGAPSSGTWLAGDVVMDSVGVLYLCTVGGTSGTWVGGGNYTTLTDVASLGTNVAHGTSHFQSRTEWGAAGAP